MTRPIPTATRRSARRSLAALALLLPLAAGACDDGPLRRDEEVEGTWALVSDSATVYLRITADSMQVYEEDPAGGCFDRVDYVILGQDGDDFRIANAADSTSEIRMQMRLDEAELVVTIADQQARYVTATLDPATLLPCDPPSTGADCATLPLLTVESETEGTLEGSDDQNPDGSRYDLYRLQPTSAANLRIDMTSGAIDSYLVLFDSVGAFLEENDDVSALTLNARIAPSVEADVCYIVMATSALADELGDYLLDVSVP